ncbi:MAG: (Fe-S)-binding protein, partial [Gammaproteobacteria bacterium]|nr:(Fe-S)-binding protein [Gammaproteobacteria bacterium]NIR94910.1 (Fe-S)-binding protein [Gammaproteobacteria bacterium]
SEITIDVARFIADILDGESVLNNMVEAEKVTYHDSCHLKRGAGVWEQPRKLLASSGREVVEMAHSDRCCGFGGSYSFTSHPYIAKEILNDKVNDIEASGAACVAMDCPGCMMQIKGGLEKQEKNVRVKHTIELLAEGLD